MVDIHTHILPEIDDGARDMKESLEMGRLAAADGVTTMVATPHALWRGETNTGPLIRGLVSDVRRVLEREGVPLVIVPAAEVPMGPGLVNILKEDPSWTIGGDGVYLLLEPPWGPLPDFWQTLIKDLIAAGITPVIAHPERSPGIIDHPEVLGQMIALGSYTQVTASSFLGDPDSAPTGLALRFLRQGRVHISASDGHNPRKRAPVMSEARAFVANMIGEEGAEIIFTENPQRLVDGQPLIKELPVLETPDPVPTGGDGTRGTGPIGSLLRRIRGR